MPTEVDALEAAARTWTTVLDAYEQHLARQGDLLAAVLAGGDGPPIEAGPTFAVPGELPPLPPALLARARQLQARTADVAARGAAARAHVERRRGRRHPAVAPPTARLVDRRV